MICLCRVAALVDLSKYRLPTIISVLSGAIETTTKPLLSSRSHEAIPIDLLQIQLYLLRILADCMYQQWATNDVSTPSKPQTASSGNPPLVSSTVPMFEQENNRDTKGRRVWNPATMSAAELVDPPPLEDSLAKQVICILLLIRNQPVIIEERENSMQSCYLSNISNTESQCMNNSDNISETAKEIYRTTCLVISYISASNWSIMFSKVKSRLMHLSTAIDENADMSEVVFLESIVLNRKNLSHVLSEITAVFIHLRKSAQLVLASVLRKVIWNWIEAYSEEFTQLYANQKRLEGGAEVLFDICSSLADTTRKKTLFWPLQTMLILLCPDLLYATTLPENRNANTKRAMFFSTLKKNIKGGIMSELATVCYSDILKAATCLSKNNLLLFKHILPDVEVELRKKLFDIHKPLPADGLATNIGMFINHRHLVADCLVSLIRFHSFEGVIALVRLCTDEKTHAIFKMGIVKALIVLILEQKKFKWFQSVQGVYAVLCRPLNKIFLDFMSRDTIKVDPSTSRKVTMNGNDKKAKKDFRVDVDERNELIYDILCLYRMSPSLAICDPESTNSNNNCIVINSITNCLRDPSQPIRDTAAACIYRFHSPDYILMWGPPDRSMETFWKISSQVLLIISKQLLSVRQKDLGIKRLLNLLKSLLVSRNEYIRLYQNHALHGSDVKERVQAAVGLEVALLVLLCSSDKDVCSDAIKCIGYMCLEEQLIKDNHHSQYDAIDSRDNFTVYSEIVTGSSIISGRKSQQKRFRKLFHIIPYPSLGNLTAWEEVWRRWKVMTRTLLRPSEELREESFDQSKKHILYRHDKNKNNNPYRPGINIAATIRVENMDDETWMEWQNYSGFLASLGGVCLMASDTQSTNSSSMSLSTSTSPKADHFFTDSTHSSHSSQKFSVSTESFTMVDTFLMEIVELLVCDNVIVREWVQEILGSDLSPTLYPVMFQHLENMLKACFKDEENPICEPQYTLFVEQAISVLKFLLNRLEENENSMFTFDFSRLIHQYAQYLNKLGTNETSLKIKIKMCQLCEVLMQRKDQITLRQEFKLRNKLLEIFVEWTSDFALNPDGLAFPSNSTHLLKIQRDLDLACLKTIVVLLHQLPLQTSEHSHDSDSSKVKSRIFYKYFTFFLKLLNRCRMSEVGDSTVSKRSTVSQDLISKNKENTSYIAPLKSYTILAMSNLLSANIDIGLKYSLSMGYYEDSKTRSSFMQVLTNILNQGTEFETLSETVMTDRCEKIIDILVDFNPNIALSLCDVCPTSEIDNVASTLLVVFESRNKIMSLFNTLIQREVQHTGKLYLFVHAISYGFKTIKYTSESKTFELDPSKVGKDEDVAKNKENTIAATEMFLDAICSSSKQAPRSFHEICSCITTVVRGRFPEASYTAVGAFIFLRFFCPVIVSPESENIVMINGTVTKEMRRGYLIATKIIQNLANNVLFGAKESFMIVLNDFLTKNIYKVTSFLREISKAPEEVDQTKINEQEGVQMTDKDYILLHRVLFDNMERISRDLAVKRSWVQDQEVLDSWKHNLDKFANLLAQLGRPPDVAEQEKLNTYCRTFTAYDQLYAEFIRQNRGRNIDVIISKNIFYESGVSKAGRTVFYYIARHVIADSIDFELMTYHILQLLERTSNKHFDLVVDLTLFDSANEIPIQWVSQLIQFIPALIIEHLGNIIVMNPNSNLRKYMKKIMNPVSHKIIKKLVMVVTLPDLHEYIIPSEVRLPKSTIELETVPSAVFFPVNRVIQPTVLIPITVKVNSEYVQLMTVRKQEVISGVNSILNDVLHISEIENIEMGYHGSTLDSFHVLNLKYGKDRTHIVLHSLKREAIINTLRYSKRSYTESQPTSLSERIVRPNDVPGRLLNMALLNIGSEDPSLRLAAYNLLYAISRAFNFDVGKQLLDTKDLCLPSNSTEFVIDISKKIASTETHLTLEFLNECFVGFQKSNESLRYLCLDYMQPWLPNLSLFAKGSAEKMEKTRDVIRLLIDLTVIRSEMHKLVQTKIWKTIAEIDDILDLVLDTFISFCSERGVASIQAEAIADTIVTLSNMTIRGKLVTRLRKALQKTSFKPTSSLTVHPAWNEITILIRFILMASFNNRGPVKSYLPEIFYIVSLVVGIGPTFIRASVHGIVINVIQSLCTSLPLPSTNIKKLKHLLNDLSESKFKILFGLAKPHTDAFSISADTTIDSADPISLSSLESIFNICLEAIQHSSPSIDLGNVWRARCMSLVTSTAFQFNPSIQPRAFVVLGCLGREEIDDDLLYQILVVLKGALSIFSDSDPSLVKSIVMCLKNIVSGLSVDSRYLPQLFWVAIALIEINSSAIFSAAVDLLQAVLNTLESYDLFGSDSISTVLLEIREPMLDTAQLLDRLCGVNFDTHFSFAIVSVLMKGVRYTDCKNMIYQTLGTILGIEYKQVMENTSLQRESAITQPQILGYILILVPVASSFEAFRELLRLAGLYEVDDISLANTYDGIFDKFDIPDSSTALLFISLLVAQLNYIENESERTFIYGLLGEAAAGIPEVFSFVYDTLLPKMNQIVISSQAQAIMESVTKIMLTACSESAFNDQDRPSLKQLLEELNFSALYDPTFSLETKSLTKYSDLASKLVDHIIA
ncbi:hypothetical protein BDF14DRAFT_1771252 [Spinellus fusiger]|nr:hypothetical protein BDF14DRAFT_1771252 [Spinellus fusiger]